MNNAEPVGWNWARTHRFQATEIIRPSSLNELQEVVAAVAKRNGTIGVVGSRHSFTNLADGDVVLDLTQMPDRAEIASDETSITVNSAMIYSRVAELLVAPNLAIANLASLPHISVAGAITTATHGSGDQNGNLATAVRSLEIVTATGELRRVQRGDAAFNALAVGLGAVGVIVAVELDTQPGFAVEQLVHDDLSWDVVLSNFDQLFASAYSVSLFTDWRDHLQLWTKRRTDQATIDHASLHDGTLAPERRHPVVGESADACTEQGPAGPWSQRLPHFRAGAVPSVGAEVQSEFFVHRAHAIDALDRLRAIGDALVPALMASEIRTVQRDELWLSHQYDQDSVGFHFTWHHDLPAARSAANAVTDALAPLRPRPHWGKVFDPSRFDFAALYPRLDDAKAVFAAWDPTGMFRTDWHHETIP